MNAGTTKKPNFGSSTREDICINKLGNSLQGLSIANEGNVCMIGNSYLLDKEVYKHLNKDAIPDQISVLITSQEEFQAC